MKVGLIVGLIVEVALGLTMPWQSGALQLTVPNTTAQYILDANAGPFPFTSIAFEFQRTAALCYYYLEASYSPTYTPPASFQDITFRFIDYSGFELRNNQSIVLDKDPTKPNLYLYVTVFGRQPADPLAYTIDAKGTPFRPCPSRCSGILAACTPQGTCQCPPERSGYDCSIQPFILSNSTNSTFTVKGSQPLYFKLVHSTIAEQHKIRFSRLSGSCEFQVYYRYVTSNSQNPVSQFQYNLTQSLSDSAETTVESDPRDFWALLLNRGPSTCDISFQFSPSASSDVITTPVIIIIVFSALMLIGIIAATIYLVKRRAPSPPIHPTQPQLLHLDDSTICRYFPTIEYSLLAPSPTISDLSKQCNICLEYLQPYSEVKIAYCNHIFHALCLKEWFVRAQNCPVCRETFDRNTVREYLRGVVKWIRKREGVTLKEGEVVGKRLAVAIWEMHRQRSLMKTVVLREMSSSLEIVQIGDPGAM